MTHSSLLVIRMMGHSKVLRADQTGLHICAIFHHLALRDVLGSG